MSLTYEEVENHLYDVFLGTKCVYIDDVLLVFKHPSNEIKQRAALIYSRSYDDAIKEGMLSNEDLSALIEKRQLVSSEDIARLHKLKGQLEAQEILLGKTTRVKANQDRVKAIVNRLKHDIFEIEFKKRSKMFMSADTKADEAKSFFICCKCVYREDGDTLFWPSYESALKDKNLSTRDSVLVSFLTFYSGKPTHIIRELARSSMWRIRYVTCMKTSEPLLGVPASEYTVDQLNLVYWSNYYQNIYEMMPESRPSDLVIDDDDALDAYMKAFYEERSREDAARRSKSKTPGKLQAFNAEEVIVTRSNELYQDIEYDQPREAQKIKDRIDLKKKAKRNR